MIDRHVTLIVWAVLGSSLVVGQFASWTSHGRLPGLGRFVRRVIANRAGRYLLVLAWMWLGWHAFAR